MRGYPDIHSLSDVELVALSGELAAEIRGIGKLIESEAAVRKRTRKILRGTVFNFVGLAAAAPTGGLSLVLCAAGLFDWADGLVDDARAMNEQLENQRIYLEKEAFLAHVQAELKRRGLI